MSVIFEWANAATAYLQFIHILIVLPIFFICLLLGKVSVSRMDKWWPW